MKPIIMILLCILLVGCTKIIELPVYINQTVNNTIYINRTKQVIVPHNIIEYISNCTEPDNKLNLRLVRELKACEYELEWLNKTDVGSKFTKANSSLVECRNKLERIEDVLE